MSGRTGTLLPLSADRLLRALRYVELNPVRAGVVGAACGLAVVERAGAHLRRRK